MVGIAKGLWSIEVPDHALRRLLERAPGVDIDATLLSHRAALRARPDDNEIAAAMVDPDMSFLLPAGPGVFVCVFRVGDDVNVGLMVHLSPILGCTAISFTTAKYRWSRAGRALGWATDSSCPHRYAACPGWEQAGRNPGVDTRGIRAGWPDGYGTPTRISARHSLIPAPTGTVSPISCRSCGRWRRCCSTGPPHGSASSWRPTPARPRPPSR